MVEDDRELAEAIHEYLVREGYDVVSVNDGDEALEFILEEDFDAIVCDLIMPNCSGEALFDAVREQRPEFCEQFVFISGHCASPSVARFLKRVHGLVLQKPFALDLLLETISTVSPSY